MAKNLHELLGIAVETVDKTTENFNRTLGLLAAIKSGEISLDRVTVTESGWDVAELPSEENPGEKAPAVAGQVGTREAG